MSRHSSSLLRLLVLLLLGTGAGACLDAGSGPVSPPRPGSLAAHAPMHLLAGMPSATDEVVEVLVGIDGGDVQIPGGHSLHFPAGALTVPTLIHAVARDGGVRVDLGPHGLVFPPGAEPTLTLSYAAAGVADPSDLAVVYLDETGAIQEVLATAADAAAHVVRARIEHFSTYALATD